MKSCFFKNGFLFSHFLFLCTFSWIYHFRYLLKMLYYFLLIYVTYARTNILIFVVSVFSGICRSGIPAGYFELKPLFNLWEYIVFVPPSMAKDYCVLFIFSTSLFLPVLFSLSRTLYYFVQAVNSQLLFHWIHKPKR